MPQAYGIGGLINVPPAAIKRSSAPAASFKGELGQIYIDSSAADASAVYVYDGNSWVQNQLSLDTDGTFASASNSTASSSLAIKTYVDATASFGAPIASDVAQGIAWTATDAQCVAGTANDATNAYMVSPDNLVAIFASPNGPIGGTAAVAGTFTDLTADGNITMTGAVACTPDSITSDNAGVAASINTGVTLITTDGDSNLDNVTLADGLIAGQIKHFAVIAAGNAADSVKITPANMAGGTQITFAADPTGLGCSMVFDGTNWTVFANNGGVIA